MNAEALPPNSPLTQPAPRPAPVLPFSRPLPVKTLLWAKRLRLIRRLGLAVLAVLLLLNCGVFWWSFQTQTDWDQQYRQLLNLRRESRNITMLKESLLGDLAGDVVSQKNLSIPRPDRTVVLAASPERVHRALVEPSTQSERLDTSVGY
ncbi:MAG: hypothetical protein H7Y22_09170 [Gemmatimonadaceae bacterium]|nr:hypothetical protein [Gloeobacterales cyanobacterium ES-bin-141]